MKLLDIIDGLIFIGGASTLIATSIYHWDTEKIAKSLEINPPSVRSVEYEHSRAEAYKSLADSRYLFTCGFVALLVGSSGLQRNRKNK